MKSNPFSPGCGLYLHSCESMAEIESDSVALTVTSPPYWNAIDYEQHHEDAEQWYRTRKGGPYSEYLDFMRRCFSEVFRVTKPGGFCAVVIGTVLMKRKHYPVPHDLTVLLTQPEVGWEFHQDITWYKVTGGVKRARVTIQKPYPGYYYPNLMTEAILIFRKPGEEPIYKNRSQREQRENEIPIDDLFKKEIANNLWHIAPVPPHHLPHPCAFPEEIPYRLILLYSYKGDAVLDPFMGIGTTPKVARIMGRRFYGYEVMEKYYTISQERLFEPLKLREQQLIAQFHKIPLTQEPLLFEK